MPTALVLCRLLHFAATMQLFGANVFVWALVPAGLARELTGPMRRMTAAAIVVAAITAFAWLALESGQMGEGWGDVLNPAALGAVSFETAFGRVWLWRLAIALALVVALAMGGRERLAFLVPASALLLASLGLVGHATLQSGVDWRAAPAEPWRSPACRRRLARRPPAVDPLPATRWRCAAKGGSRRGAAALFPGSAISPLRWSC